MELENHGEISAKVAETRLRRDAVIGNYLIRHFGKDLIISYLDVHHQVKHALIPFAKNCTFRQQNPDLKTREDILNFILENSVDFIYLINPPQEALDSSPESAEELSRKAMNICPVCEDDNSCGSKRNHILVIDFLKILCQRNLQLHNHLHSVCK